MTKFEDHLWREFVREHGHDLAQVRRAAARPSLRPRVVAAGGLGLAGAGVGLALALGATTAAPAFAVARNHDGTVTVDILRSSGVAGANAKLHQLGIRAEVMSTPPAACSPCATRGPVPSDHQRSLDHQPAHDSRSPDAGAHSGIRGQQREQRAGL